MAITTLGIVGSGIMGSGIAVDDESMKIQADTGEFVNRRGIHPPLADADKIKFVQMYQFGKEDYETKKKEYQKIFLQ